MPVPVVAVGLGAFSGHRIPRAGLQVRLNGFAQDLVSSGRTSTQAAGVPPATRPLVNVTTASVTESTSRCV